MDKIVAAAIVVATLTGGNGGKAAEIIAAMAGVATGNVETVGTTAGVETAVEHAMAARGAIATFAGGIIGSTIVADGTDGTITVGGTLDRTIDAREVIGHGTCAGDETNIHNRAR